MRITYNGVDYNSPDDMPPAVRKAYERALGLLKDEDSDGIPDIAQRGEPGVEAVSIQHTSYTVNGRTYASLDEMPPKIRRVFESMTERSGTPRNQFAPSRTTETIDTSDKPDLEWTITTTTAEINRFLLIALLLVGLLAAALAVLLAWSWWG